LVHELGVEFCEQMMEICLRDPMFSQRVLFSDEAIFSLNGTVNRQNVWTGMIDDRILGALFFANNLTGVRYLQFLQLELMPGLAALFPNENNPDLPNNTILLQQDGAPSHYAVYVRR
jgi:hypothetical protein